MHPTTFSSLRVTGAAALLLALAACGGDGPSGNNGATDIEYVSGQDQSVPAGTVVPIEPTVRLVDGAGEPVSGVTVTFVVTGGGGTVTASTPETNGSGIASVGSWTLGATPGTNSLQARVNGVPSFTFTAVGTAAAPSGLNKTAGDNVTTAASADVDPLPTVRVIDDNGAPIANVTVTFSVATGGGTITGATPQTNATGYATVGSWTLGATNGAQTLTASVAGLPSVTFTATAVAPSSQPAAVQVYVGDDQTSQVSIPVPVPPAVRVVDGGGQPVQYAVVNFTVQAGGGTVSGTKRVTDQFGIARVGEWRLGAAQGTNTLRASVAGAPPLDIAATGRAIDNGAFNLTLRFVSPVTPEQYAAFELARERWEAVITGNLQSLQLTGQVVCTGAPGLAETVDDLVIFVNLVPIDGPGLVLGSAGPCAIRNSNGLPIAGVMNFDVADLAQMEANLTLSDVVLHEMGHVVGIGSLWNIANPARTLLSGEGGDDPFFVGTAARAAFEAAGGNVYGGNKVPVENTGGAGTRDSHWREGRLGNELMTGFIGVGANPLSAITLGSLQDMGYQVNASLADAFTYTAGAVYADGARSASLSPLTEAPLAGPILVVDERGRTTGTIERRH